MENSSFCRDFDTDDNIDAIFAAAFDVLHQSGPAPTDVETTDPTSSTPTTTCNVNTRLAPPKTDNEIKQLRYKGILEDTHYCMKVWEQWCNYARQTGRDIPPIQIESYVFCIPMAGHPLIHSPTQNLLTFMLVWIVK